jgi:hypothetical protein
VANDATLTDLQNRALDKADMTGSSFYDSTRLTNDINSGLAELHDLLIANYAEDYKRSTQSITLLAGTEAYALPSAFYKALRVWRIASGRRHLIDRFTLEQLDGYNTTGPASSGAAELWYAPQLTKLSAGGDVVDAAVPIGYEDFAVYHAAAQLKIREQSDARELIEERERIRQRIIAYGEDRDRGAADHIEDHYNRWGGGVCDEESRTLRYRIMGANIHFVEMDWLGV